MGKASIFDNIREWIGGVAFAIFLWSARMTEDEYIDELISSARITPRAAEGGDGALEWVCDMCIPDAVNPEICAKCGKPRPKITAIR